GQTSEDGGDLAFVGAGELRQRGSAARVLRALAGLDEPQEHPAGEYSLPGVERLEDAIRRSRDCGSHAAGASIRIQGERATVARGPCGQQRVGEEWKRARFPGDLAHEEIDQGTFDAQPARASRLDDGFAQILFAHRTKKQLLSRDGSRERRVARAAAVEVGADPDYDWSVVVENR